MSGTTPRPMTLARARELTGQPERLATTKVADRITEPFRRFIAHSPFLTIASSDGRQCTDSSPRGDYPGFVKVLDDRTLAIPDRLGNRRLDSFRNIDHNPAVGLLFFVPGASETLRVNGNAYLSDDADVLVRLEAEGKPCTVALIVKVIEAFAHCGRSILRSRLWQQDSQLLAHEVPSMTEMLVDQARSLDVTTDAVQADVDAATRELY